MNGSNALYRFDLDDHLILDEEVDPEGIPEQYSVIFKRDRLLTLDSESLAREIARQDSFVDCFQQAWSQHYVQL